MDDTSLITGKLTVGLVALDLWEHPPGQVPSALPTEANYQRCSVPFHPFTFLTLCQPIYIELCGPRPRFFL